MASSSTLFSSNDRFLKWHYIVNRIAICYPDGGNYKTVDLPTERVTGWDIIHDYESNIFPIFRLTMTLTSDQYYTILEWARGDGTEDDDSSTSATKRLKFYVDIRKFYREVGSMERSEVTSKYFSGFFYLILDDEAYDSETGFKEAEDAEDPDHVISDRSTDMEEIKNPVEFYLFKCTDIKASRKTVSVVLPNAKVADGVNYILSKATSLKKILMSKPSTRGSGNTKIDELIIPPLTCFQALSYLDCYYGLYKNGSMIYADYDRFYLLHNWYKCDAYEKNEYKKVSIVVVMKGSKWTQEQCAVDKADTSNKVYYMLCDNDQVDIKNEATTFDVLVGNDVETSDTYTGTSSTEYADVITAGGSTTQSITNMTENPFFTTTYTAQTSSLGSVITVNLGNIDVTNLTPNRQFNIIFEDTELNAKYNGYYKMANAQHNFIKRGDEFDVTSVVTLKCKKDLSDTSGS